MTMTSIWTPLAVAGLASLLLACGETPAPDAGGEAATVEPAPAQEAGRFTVLVGGAEIGELVVARDGDAFDIAYEYRNNGRGPTINERVELGADGLPQQWRIEGASTFGNPVDETFELRDGEARWRDNTGSDSVTPSEPAFYLPESSSPYAIAIAARALMQDEDGEMPALPGGELRLGEIESFEVEGAPGRREVTAYSIAGTSRNPTYFLMHGDAFFGLITPGFAILESGFEAEDERLRGLAAEYAARRFDDIQSRYGRRYNGPVRVRNVRIFDAVEETLGEPVSVVVEGNRIAAIEALDAAPADGETVIEGGGGTLVPGLFDMHAHLGETAAVLNVISGVTSVRDMGNNNDVLEALVERIQTGEIAGPRVYRSGFIEGESPFNSNNGILVSSEAEAVAAVETYAEHGGFHQVKIYNSMDPAWIPAVIEAAHARGLRVAGHVPAFTNADAMIEAGYDELTHINQVMLGWVLEEGEDTRTLLRLTALRRLPGLDLSSAPVQSTLDAMARNGVAIDPTLAIHEALLLSRNGTLSPGVVDYIDHMPIDDQRSARSAWADIATPEDDAAYRGAWEQILATVTMMRERGIMLVPGTDLGGAFAHHRELELYQQTGMSASEVLGWATHGMADYLGVSEDLGSIETGKLADFFLVPGNPTEDLAAIKTISMVMADGVVYYPAQIYPEFGIRPFAEPPVVAEQVSQDVQP
ncbi:amidohydrolase family protein [Maricaulis sp. CAU 1757]